MEGFGRGGDAFAACGGEGGFGGVGEADVGDDGVAGGEAVGGGGVGDFEDAEVGVIRGREEVHFVTAFKMGDVGRDKVRLSNASRA